VKPIPDAIGMRIEELLLNHGPWIGIDDFEYDKFPWPNHGVTEAGNSTLGIHAIQRLGPSAFARPYPVGAFVPSVTTSCVCVPPFCPSLNHEHT
jgi:hypothetical protein